MLEGFGRYLRNKRRSDGKTMGALARLLGCPVSHVSDVERGLVPPPGETALRVWLTTIGVDGEMEMLVGWGATTRTAYGDAVAEGMTGIELYQELQKVRGQLAQLAYATYGCNFDEADPLEFQTLFDRIAALSQLEVHLGTDYEPEDGDIVDAIAAEFHRQYEMRAHYHGYKTRDASAVPWAEVPDQNKGLMREVVAVLLDEGIIEVGGCLDVSESDPLKVALRFDESVARHLPDELRADCSPGTAPFEDQLAEALAWGAGGQVVIVQADAADLSDPSQARMFNIPGKLCGDLAPPITADGQTPVRFTTQVKFSLPEDARERAGLANTLAVCGRPKHSHINGDGDIVFDEDITQAQIDQMVDVSHKLLRDQEVDLHGTIDPVTGAVSVSEITPRMGREARFVRQADGDGRLVTVADLRDALTVDRVRGVARLEMDISFGNLEDHLLVADAFLAIADAIVREVHPNARRGILAHGAQTHALAYVELRQLAREAGAEFEGHDPDVRDMARAVRRGLGKRMVEVVDWTWCSSCEEPGPETCGCGEMYEHPLYRLAPENAMKIPGGVHIVSEADVLAAKRPLDAIIAGSVYLKELTGDRMVSRNVIAAEGDRVRYVEFDSRYRDGEGRVEPKPGECSVAEFLTWHAGPQKAPDFIPGFRVVFQRVDGTPYLTFVEVEDMQGNSIDVGRWNFDPSAGFCEDGDGLCALELPALTIVPKEPSLLISSAALTQGDLQVMGDFVRSHGAGPHMVLSQTVTGGRRGVGESLISSGKALSNRPGEPAEALARAAEVLEGTLPLIRALGGPERVITETKCGRLDDLIASVVDGGRGNPPLAYLVTRDGHCHVISSGNNGPTQKIHGVIATHIILARELSKVEAQAILPRLAPNGKWRFINEHWSAWHSAESAWDAALIGRGPR